MYTDVHCVCACQLFRFILYTVYVYITWLQPKVVHTPTW